MAVVSRAAQSEALAGRIRRQRQALHLSLTEAAELAQVSTGFLSMLENGSSHQPGYDRLTRVANALGLGPYLIDPPGAAREPSQDLVAALGSCLSVIRSAQLSDLARATHSSLVEVRQALRQLNRELAACGMRVVDSGYEAALVPVPKLAPTAAAITKVRCVPMTESRMTVLAIVAAYGAATRRLVDEITGRDSADLLVGLVSDEYLEASNDETAVGRPYIYRLTSRVIEEIGMETVEELRSALGRHGASTAHDPVTDSSESVPGAPDGE